MPAFNLADLPPATAVVMNDAGAANIIVAWIDAGLVPAARVYAEGPAAQLWARRSRPPLMPSLETALSEAAFLVSGTGWESSIEHDARLAARRAGHPSAAVIDHWVNYAARFERQGRTVLPDEVWVTDHHASARAKATFGDLTVRELPNLYLEDEVAAIAAHTTGDVPRDLLYVLEPARDGWGKDVPGEFQALDYLVDHWPRLGLTAGAKLRLRPHPSERLEKYDEWIAQHRDLPAERDLHSSLSEAISGAGAVAGCNSFAMVVALAAGRPTICTLPPWAPPCVLPHDGLIHLKDLARA